MGWADDEFKEIDLGDKRLDSRLIKLCEAFSQSPESPINQACADWAETKAAYRFFKNKNVDVERIMSAHRQKTVGRAKGRDTVLAIQDTSYFIYTSHPKTKGLGDISMTKGKNINKIYSRGLVMHTCLGVTTKGTPLGLFDQKIFSRKLHSEQEHRTTGGRKTHDLLPVEEKESYRWIETLETTLKVPTQTEIVTVCDRECDFYDFFKIADKNNSIVLVRASQNRTINRKSRYAEKNVMKLWEYISSKPTAGTYTIDISARQKTKHCKERKARKAQMEIKFGNFKLNPPRNHFKHKTEILPNIPMYVIHACEKHPPEGEDAVEWMLLTNQVVKTLAEACERVRWYILRWRIEMYFKVLKSGFRVEACRLGTASRLICYLTLMSIVAWRLFMITLIARTNPSKPCSEFLTKLELSVFVAIMSSNGNRSVTSPAIADVVTEIAKLGGYLARKKDGPPGTLVLWRGWKRLIDITEGWSMALRLRTCG